MNKKQSFGLSKFVSADDLGQILFSILLVLFVFLLLGGLAYFLSPSEINLTIARNSLLMAGITLVSVFLLQKHQVSLSAVVMLFACGAVLLGAAWQGDGVRGPAYFLCGLLVLGASLLWGQRGGFLVALVVGGFGLIMLVAGRANSSSSQVSGWFLWIILLANFLLLAVMPGGVLRQLEKLISQVRGLNADLEQRVVERTAQLAESERILKIISENVQDIIWTADLQMHTTFITASAARLRGFTVQEMLDEPLHKALTPDSYALAMELLREEIEREAQGDADPNRSRVVQLDYYRKDGSIIRMEVRASFLRDEQGRPIGVTGINRDITERHWMEKALLESEERYRKITSVISDYIYSAKVNAQGQFSPEWVAGAFAEITGYEFDEYLAVGGWETLLHPDSVSQDMLDRSTLLTNAPLEGSVLKIRRKDGSIRWVRNYAQPVWSIEENRLTGVYGGVQDITPEKQAIERLQVLNNELEKRVAERTTKLENALAELESFSYSISHDLRAPLRAINGYSGLLLTEYRRELPGKVIEKLESVKESSQRMGQLVDGLLEFLKSGREPIERQQVNPGEIVQSVLERMQPQLENRQVQIQVQTLPPCSANLRLLDKVYEGLISNAIKFTRNCEKTIVEIGALEQDGLQVYFVRDNGVGFDMKYYDKLFGVFQRLHHLSEFDGIGASLAIVHRIINRHGGRIWAEAEVGKGATFYFTLGG